MESIIEENSMDLAYGKVLKMSHILENGRKDVQKGMAYINGKMVTDMKANGSTH